MQPRSDAIGRIEVSTGDSGWPQAAPLLRAVWPSEVVATLPWRDVVWAHADHRVLVYDSDGTIVGHVGLFIRIAQWNARNVKIGGIGGVATREDRRRKGIASFAMQRAMDELRQTCGRFWSAILRAASRATLSKARLARLRRQRIRRSARRPGPFHRHRPLCVRSQNGPPSRYPGPVRAALVILISQKARIADNMANLVGLERPRES